jgi:phosphoribosylformimino-5-aminoimidazole carboxamide ribotide isomerase
MTQDPETDGTAPSRSGDAPAGGSPLAEWLGQPIGVIPAVDVLGEAAVRLHQGDYGDVVEEAGDPVALARRFARAGAPLVHLVDLDGARSGRVRPELVRLVADAVAPARLQASGGIRNPGDAESLLDAGAERIVLGTAAFPEPAPWVEAFGERLVVALDVRDGQVRTAGWTSSTGLSLAEATERCLAAGVVRVLCTAIDRDGTLAGPDLALVRTVAASGVLTLAAGGIRSPADVAALAQAGAEAAVVGRALLAEGR